MSTLQQFPCPKCGIVLRLSSAAGAATAVRCTRCAHTFAIPKVPAAVPALEPPSPVVAAIQPQVPSVPVTGPSIPAPKPAAAPVAIQSAPSAPLRGPFVAENIPLARLAPPEGKWQRFVAWASPRARWLWQQTCAISTRVMQLTWALTQRVYRAAAADRRIAAGVAVGLILMLVVMGSLVSAFFSKSKEPETQVASNDERPAPTVAQPPVKEEDPPQPPAGRPGVAAARLAWRQKLLVDGYEKFGRKKPDWDSPARDSLKNAVVIWDKPEAHSDREERCFDGAKAALDKGCDDPLVLFWFARMHTAPRLANWTVVDRHLSRAAAGMQQSNYPDILKALAYATAAHHRLRAANQVSAFAAPIKPAELMKEAMVLLPAIVKDKDVPGEELSELARQLTLCLQRMGLSPERSVEEVGKAMNGSPKGRAALLAVEGWVRIELAWQARGSGFADTVTPAQWKLFREQLAKSERALDEAWRLDPTNSAIPINCISLEVGQGKGRERMEMWFDRAMELDPFSMDACRRKLYYIEPKWYGSVDDMLEFGRALAKEQNWTGGLPLMLVETHLRLSRYAKDPAAYLKLPEVWRDIQLVFEPRLAKNPKVRWERTRYLDLAIQCGRPDVALEQFKILGDNYSRAIFPNPQQYAALRRQVEQQVAK